MAQKKEMKQISISIRLDKYEFLQAWAEDRDESMSTICRGWIYTGLEDLQQALGQFGVGPVMNTGCGEDNPPMELEIPEPETQGDPDEGSVEQTSVH